jgi:hypothetical protein
MKIIATTALALCLATAAYAESSFPSGSVTQPAGGSTSPTWAVLNWYVLQQTGSGSSDIPGLNNHNQCGSGQCSVPLVDKYTTYGAQKRNDQRREDKGLPPAIYTHPAKPPKGCC